MKPRKLTKTLKEQLDKKKEISNLKRKMTIQNRKSVASTLLPKNVLEDMYSTAHIKSLDTRASNTGRSSIMEERHKEAPEVRAAIEKKANCLAPAYSKGAYQYIADEESAKCAGRKNV